MGRDNLVIVGGVAAGLAAAMEARRASPDLPVTVLERTADISYGACGLPYVVAGLIPSLADLVVHTPEYFRDVIGPKHFKSLKAESRELVDEPRDGLPADFNEMLSVVRQRGWTK